MNRTTFLQDVYSVVAAIPEGCVVTYGQIASLVGRSQCSRMVGQAMHNVPEDKIFRPAAWNAFGMDKEGADYRACANYGALYKPYK